MFWLLVAFLACSSSTASALARDELIPQLDGTLKFMTGQEIEETKAAAPFYDPYSDIDFHLYTPLNPTESQIIPIYDSAALRNSNFNPAYPTIYIAHGWGGDIRDGTIQLARREYLAKGNYNIFGSKKIIFT